MRAKDFIFNEQQELAVIGTTDKEVTLIDPKTKVKTVVPKDPNKPGIIKMNTSTNKLEYDPKNAGAVDDDPVKPGAKVVMKPGV
jgi:hypothetical protein